MKKPNLFVCLCAAMAVCLLSNVSRGEDWGTLSGRFVVKGELPKPAAIDANKDPEVCGKVPLFDETVVVDKDGGLANIMIYLAKKPAMIHPDYKKTAKDKVVLDNKGCRFEPHTLVMRAGQTLVIKNSDAIGHNSNVAFSVNSPTNPLIPSGQEYEVAVDEAESAPTQVSCNIHPWMKAQVLVRADPYSAASGKDGKFEIKNLPVGGYEFIVRGEKYITKVNVGGKDATWVKGHYPAEIKAGANDLGDIVVDVSNLK